MTLRHTLAPAAVALGALVAVAGSGIVAGGAPAAEQPRPFRHATHTALACGECHGTGAQHRVGRAWPAEACAACHHDPRRNLECGLCHEPADYAAPRPVLLHMTLTVRPEPVARPVDFDHIRHATLACAQCHSPEAGVRLTPPACASCHADHHGGAAECSTCHLPASPGAHDLAVHATCAGGACHAIAAERQPVLSRSLCLLCHAEQREHEPGLPCHECHRVPYH